MLKNYNQQSEAIRSQENGIKYIAAFSNIFDHIPQHRGLTNGLLSGDANLKDRLQSLHETIQQDFQQIEVVNKQYGNGSSVSESWKKLRLRWQEIQDGSPHMKANEAFQAQSDWISDCRLLLGEITLASHLDSTSGADSVFMQTMITRKIPDLTESISQMRDKLYGYLISNQFTPSVRMELATYLGKINLAYSQFQEELNRIQLANRESYDLIASDLAQIDKSYESFLKPLQKQIRVNSDTLPVAADMWNRDGMLE